MDTRSQVQTLLSDPHRPFAVRLWDGSWVPPLPASAEVPTLVLTHERAAAAFGFPVSEERLAEAFLSGDVEMEGDLVRFLELAASWPGPEGLHLTAVVTAILAEIGGWASALLHAAGRHTLGRDDAAVRHHYDVGNDFYRLFLDEEMVYSCAYWAPGVDGLAAAQAAKLELVCRKLGLTEGERLLDIGCGWGALVLHAARRHGVRATGITLSPAQREVADERVRGEPRGKETVEIRLADYRQLPEGERWDKLASVGMMEHVGRQELGRYFAVLHGRLVPGGLLLNHAIAESSDGRRTIPWLHRNHGGFIQQEIFPDTDLPPLELVVDAARHAGFEVLDVEALRPHYARTLLEWLGRLERRFPEAVQLVGKRRARAWRLYLAASAVSFRIGRITVYQVLLQKRQEGALPQPVDRRRWYEGLDRLRANAGTAPRKTA
jgi:cyclopropane-fatty-acyl-phospholipid synthase